VVYRNIRMAYSSSVQSSVSTLDRLVTIAAHATSLDGDPHHEIVVVRGDLRMVGDRGVEEVFQVPTCLASDETVDSDSASP